MKRIMMVLIILLLASQYAANSQCVQAYNLDQSLTIQGINNGIDHYYQNLIIQDIALASQKAFRDISLHFNYKIQYMTDYCRPEQIEIKVLPVVISSSPLYYQGYDISHAVGPEKADLVFHLVHPDKFVSDSLIFFDIPVNQDSNLYTTLITERSDLASDITVTFSRAVFHYTKSSYELFRDHILGIDKYFAAQLIADSAKIWAEKGFLSEKATYAEQILRQIELERIIDYIRPQQFESLLFTDDTQKDELTAKCTQLQKINTRLKAIIRYNQTTSWLKEDGLDDNALLNRYHEWFDHYYRLSYSSDFRYFNFIESLGIPGFDNADLIKLYSRLSHDYHVPSARLNRWKNLLPGSILEKGAEYEDQGDQLRALKYYQSAYEISSRLFLENYQKMAALQAARMKDSIATSYLQISRKSALSETPKMAAQYYRQAVALFDGEIGDTWQPSWLNDYETWLYQNFEDLAVSSIGLKDYKKALSYLTEIEFRCQSDENYPCPEQFHEWMRLTREGLYHELLYKSKSLLVREEYQDAMQKYRQAVTMRLGAGYRIDKNVEEALLEMRFRQLHYDELFEEGIRFYEKEEYSSALYFFNKADHLAKSGLPQPATELETYRQAAARQVIMSNLSEGRVKVWAHDFENADALADLIKIMLSDYNIAGQDSLTMQYLQLAENVRQKSCEVIMGKYEDLMSAAGSARQANEYRQAYKLVSDAVNLSMEHLDCGIRDEEAWYQKVILEGPAEFQKKESDLHELAYVSYVDYLESFQEHRSYYNRHKLLSQGISFAPLFDRVMMVRDSAFLHGMLGSYLKMKDYDRAFKLLVQMKGLNIPPSSLKEEQQRIAGFMAVRDSQNDTLLKPWDTLQEYTGRDRWFRAFRRKYIKTWLHETHWKLKYWPFIWKK